MIRWQVMILNNKTGKKQPCSYYGFKTKKEAMKIAEQYKDKIDGFSINVEKKMM